MSQRLVLLDTPKKSLAQTNANVGNDATYVGPYHCVRSVLQLKAIKDTIREMQKSMSGETNWEIGSVYVIEEGDSKYVKIGYTNSEGLKRAQEHINTCHLSISRMYLTPGFRGAYKAEQILLKLTAEHNFRRYDCACRWNAKSTSDQGSKGSKSKKKGKFRKDGTPRCHEEWLQQSYEEAVATVLLVCDWMRYQTPYEPIEMDNESEKVPELWNASLKPEWVDSLQQWKDTQYTKAPLGWQDFFWRHELFWRGASVHQSPGRRGPRASATPQGTQEASSPSSNRTPRFVGNIPISNQEIYQSTIQRKTTEIHEELHAGGISVIRDTRMESSAYRASRTVERTAAEADSLDQYSESPCPPENRKGRRTSNVVKNHSPIPFKVTKKNRETDLDIANLSDISDGSSDALNNITDTDTGGQSDSIDDVCSGSHQDDGEEQENLTDADEASGNTSEGENDSTDDTESFEDTEPADISESEEDDPDPGEATQTPRSVSPDHRDSNTGPSRRSQRLMNKRSISETQSSKAGVKASADRTDIISAPEQQQPNDLDETNPMIRQLTRVLTGGLKRELGKITGKAKKSSRKGKK